MTRSQHSKLYKHTNYEIMQNSQKQGFFCVYNLLQYITDHCLRKYRVVHEKPARRLVD